MSDYTTNIREYRDKLSKFEQADYGCYRVASTMEECEDKLKDGDKPKDMEWEFEDIRADFNEIKRSVRVDFKKFCKANFPKTTRALKW